MAETLESFKARVRDVVLNDEDYADACEDGKLTFLEKLNIDIPDVTFHFKVSVTMPGIDAAKFTNEIGEWDISDRIDTLCYDNEIERVTVEVIELKEGQ